MLGTDSVSQLLLHMPWHHACMQIAVYSRLIWYLIDLELNIPSAAAVLTNTLHFLDRYCLSLILI